MTLYQRSFPYYKKACSLKGYYLREAAIFSNYQKKLEPLSMGSDIIPDNSFIDF